MNDQEKTRTEREARIRLGDPRRTTARGEAVNRYLGAIAYTEAHGDRPAARREPAERSPR
jgi:hypothetical protein